MQKVSPECKAEFSQAFARPCSMRITFGLTDPDAAPDCTVHSDLPQADYSRADSLLTDGGVLHETYATLEPGRMRADGSQRILPPDAFARVYTEGFVSAALSGADGSFAADSIPALRLQFSARHTVPGLTFTFDPSCGDYPALVRLKAFRGSTAVFSKEYTPESAVFTTRDALEKFDRLVLEFPRTAKPFRRMRLQQLIFGFGLVFDGAQITSAVQQTEIDPIMRRLPKNSFEFTVVNINTLTGSGTQYLYDPDNASGIYRYISEQNPLTVEYRQELAGGEAIIPAGRYLLTGQPSVDGLTARFKAQDALSGLSRTYEKGVYAAGGRNLYELAQDVLRDSGLRPFSGNLPPWKLWEGLADFTTAAPLPAKPHRELLQLIAHAACCVLYTDREGFIRIEPAADVQHEDVIGLSEMLERPKTSQIPTLMRVECPVSVYAPAETAEQLHSKSYKVSGTLHLHLSYPQAADVSVRVSGVSCTGQHLYAGSADLILSGSGTAQVTVTGRKLSVSTHTVAADVPGVSSGCTETLHNPLITDRAHALAVAEWVRSWLVKRNTYEFEYRGRPDLDAGDLVRIESPFSPQPVPVHVLKTELRYSGGLRGKITAKRNEESYEKEAVR